MSMVFVSDGLRSVAAVTCTVSPLAVPAVAGPVPGPDDVHAADATPPAKRTATVPPTIAVFWVLRIASPPFDGVSLTGRTPDGATRPQGNPGRADRIVGEGRDRPNGGGARPIGQRKGSQ